MYISWLLACTYLWLVRRHSKKLPKRDNTVQLWFGVSLEVFIEAWCRKLAVILINAPFLVAHGTRKRNEHWPRNPVCLQFRSCVSYQWFNYDHHPENCFSALYFILMSLSRKRKFGCMDIIILLGWCPLYIVHTSQSFSFYWRLFLDTWLSTIRWMHWKVCFEAHVSIRGGST